MLPRVRGGWTAAGILILVLATAAVAGWAVSWWIVPPYVALMAWLLLPAEDRSNRAEPSSMIEPVPPDPTIAVPAVVESEPTAEPPPSGSARPARSRKPRARSKSKDREPSLAAVEPMQVNWVQVAPGKFVRVESPQPSTIEEPSPNPVEIDGESPPVPNLDVSCPPDPPPDVGPGWDDETAGADPPLRPDEPDPADTMRNAAPDHDDPGPDGYPEPESEPESESRLPETPHDEHLGYAEVREPGGEDAAITPTEPVGACQAEPGPADDEAPQGGSSDGSPSPEEPGVAGIAPDASGEPAARASAKPAAPTLLPLRVDGWPGRLLDDRAGRTRGPIVGNPPLPTSGLDRGRYPGPGRQHGRHRHDRPFHQAPPRKQPTRGPPR